MLTVRQIAESDKVSAGTAVTQPADRRTAPKELKLVKPGMSAIEYIVATARPGEVIHVFEEEYYNPHLWRSYRGSEILR